LKLLLLCLAYALVSADGHSKLQHLGRNARHYGPQGGLVRLVGACYQETCGSLHIARCFCASRKKFKLLLRCVTGSPTSRHKQLDSSAKTWCTPVSTPQAQQAAILAAEHKYIHLHHHQWLCQCNYSIQQLAGLVQPRLHVLVCSWTALVLPEHHHLSNRPAGSHHKLAKLHQ
jgi:hypothetical protein